MKGLIFIVSLGAGIYIGYKLRDYLLKHDIVDLKETDLKD